MMTPLDHKLGNCNLISLDKPMTKPIPSLIQLMPMFCSIPLLLIIWFPKANIKPLSKLSDVNGNTELPTLPSRDPHATKKNSTTSNSDSPIILTEDLIHMPLSNWPRKCSLTKTLTERLNYSCYLWNPKVLISLLLKSIPSFSEECSWPITMPFSMLNNNKLLSIKSISLAPKLG